MLPLRLWGHERTNAQRRRSVCFTTLNGGRSARPLGLVLASILKAHSHLRGTLFDVPRVAAAALSIAPRVLLFDRFALDLTRGNLRQGDQDIDLRPKAFDVLRHLAENARRLVPKDELYQAVWPDIAVTDDSLVQCIGELRHKLGDEAHRLIKTVPRRGYLLDVPCRTSPAGEFVDEPALGPLDSSRPAARAPRRIVGALRERKWLVGAGAAAIVCSALGAAYLSVGLFAPSTASELFLQEDARRVAAIAADKEIPLPPFQISRIERDVPAHPRRFVGIWASSTGFINSNRQFMVIITDVEKAGILAGFTIRGPRQPLSVVKSPAGSAHFRAYISGDSFRYSGPASEREVVLTAGNRLEFSEVFTATGATMRVVLDPVWTLVEAERAALAQPRTR
jgi:DNA-binding winged helix-turn-helix (wHTH) protein